MEEVHVLGRRTVHCGGLLPPTRALHLGQGHRLSGEDADRAERRDSPGHSGEHLMGGVIGSPGPSKDGEPGLERVRQAL